VGSREVVNGFYAPELQLSNIARATASSLELVVSVFEAVIILEEVVVPAFMDFIAYCQDSCVAEIIIGPRNRELVSHSRLGERIHKEFNHGDYSHMASFEVHAKVARNRGIFKANHIVSIEQSIDG